MISQDVITASCQSPPTQPVSVRPNSPSKPTDTPQDSEDYSYIPATKCADQSEQPMDYVALGNEYNCYSKEQAGNLSYEVVDDLPGVLPRVGEAAPKVQAHSFVTNTPPPAVPPRQGASQIENSPPKPAASSTPPLPTKPETGAEPDPMLKPGAASVEDPPLKPQLTPGPSLPPKPEASLEPEELPAPSVTSQLPDRPPKTLPDRPPKTLPDRPPKTGADAAPGEAPQAGVQPISIPDLPPKPTSTPDLPPKPTSSQDLPSEPVTVFLPKEGESAERSTEGTSPPQEAAGLDHEKVAERTLPPEKEEVADRDQSEMFLEETNTVKAERESDRQSVDSNRSDYLALSDVYSAIGEKQDHTYESA